MLEILLDVLGSMEGAFAVNYDKCNDLTDEKVKRSHRIITIPNNIVNREITAYGRKDLVFGNCLWVG